MYSQHTLTKHQDVIRHFERAINRNALHRLTVRCAVASFILLLCVSKSFAYEYIRTEDTSNAWSQNVFNTVISKDDNKTLYTITAGHTYTGGSTYSNTNDPEISGMGGLIYESTVLGGPAVTISILGSGDTTISDWKLRGESPTGQLARGGVIYAGDLIIEDKVTFEDNYVFGTHKNNFAYGGEGGVIFANQLNLAGGSTFSKNFADARGGAIAGSGAIRIGEKTTFKGNVSSSGGAISNVGTKATLTIGAGSVFEDNRAFYGGAIASPAVGSTVTINDGTVFTNNMAENVGGALNVANVNFNYTGTQSGLVVSSGNTIAALPRDTEFTEHIAFPQAGQTVTPDNNGEGGFLYLQANSTATFNVADQYKIVRIGENDDNDTNRIYAADANLDSMASGTDATFAKTGAGILVVNSRLEDFKGTVWVKEGVMDIRRANLGDGETTIFAGGSSVAAKYGDANYALLNFYNDALGVDYEKNNIVNGAVIAGRNGVVMLGTEKSTSSAPSTKGGLGGLGVPENEWTPERFASYNIPWGVGGVSSIMLVREQHKLDATGSLTADNALSSATSVAANTVNFGHGSLFIADYDSINANLSGDFANTSHVENGVRYVLKEGNAALKGDGSTKLNVSGDAMLLLATADSATPKKGDVYLVLENFDASKSAHWTSSQIHINKIGLDWDDMIGGWRGNDFYVLVRDVKAKEAFKDSGLDEDLLDVLDEAASDGKDLNTDAEDAGERFVSRVTDGDRLKDQKEQVKHLEGTAKTTFVAAIPQVALSVSNSFSSALETRTSTSSSVHQGVAMRRDDNGQWQQNDMSKHAREINNGASLWAIGHHEQQKASFGTGNFDADYDASFSGVSFGGDYAFSSKFLAGVAFHVGSGDVRSTGDFSGTSNDFEYAGAGIYAAYTDRNLALHADIAYTMLSNDIGRALPASVKASDTQIGGTDSSGNAKTGTRTLSDLHADNDTTALTAGLRAAYTFTANRFNIMPHVGFRATHIESKAYDVKSGAEAVICMRDMDATIYQVPVGLTVSTLRTFDNNWTMRPYADLSFIAAFGDLEATQGMQFAGLSTDVALDANIADAFTTRATLGLDFSNDTFGFGLNGFYQNSESLQSIGANVSFMYAF